jgi:ribonucleoside-triphosphate reductase (thioredoxin)
MPNEQIVTPFSTIGYITLKRTYARRLQEDNPDSPTEELSDIVERVVEASNTQLGCNFTDEEKDRLSGYLLKLKGTVAGRFLWQLGTKTVDTLGLASLQNCAFTVIDSPVRPFTWAMDLLMLGSGVGFNIQKHNIDKLPIVNPNFSAPTRLDNSSAEYIISDTRQGWVALLGKTLKAAFLSDKRKPTFTFSTQLIRGKGATIKGFGGTASGPEDLCWGIEKISEVLLKRSGKQIRPIDALDIMNIIGAVVVAGNVRRSAQLCIGDCDDVEYLLAKRWDMGNIPSWRAMSNNSVVCADTKDLHDYFWDGYEGKGEPYGLINLKLSRKIGRLGETQYPDPNVAGYNPCLSGDTLVDTSLGQKTMKELSELDSVDGILVKSYDESTGEVVWKPLKAAFLTKKMAQLIKLKVRSKTGELLVLKLTPDHQVFTKNRGWVEAAKLNKEDELVLDT